MDRTLRRAHHQGHVVKAEGISYTKNKENAMGIYIILFIAVIFLAYSNGANDNFKGVATLFGSGIADYRWALIWATITTFAGSMGSFFLASTLIKNFSGKGIVSETLAGSPHFLVSVALAAGLTVIIATITGFPISTTHSLTGALVGVALVAEGSRINFSILGQSFLIPLLVSPFIAVIFASILYRILKYVKRTLRIVPEDMCICAGEVEKALSLMEPSGRVSMTTVSMPHISMDTHANCTVHYGWTLFGVNMRTLLTWCHYLSAGMVSFARGLNDTPKIMALMVAFKVFNIHLSMFSIALAMAMGGIINARRVARTMAEKITPLSEGKGLTANITTSAMVILGSLYGMPLSTTHVSVGSLFGIGTVTGTGNKKVISEILLSWILTLPVAALFSALLFTTWGRTTLTP